jgi:hypothetical protein
MGGRRQLGCGKKGAHKSTEGKRGKLTAFTLRITVRGVEFTSIETGNTRFLANGK